MPHEDFAIRMPAVRARRPALRDAWALLRRWCARRRQRYDLGELDDRLLGDIGLTREEAEAERRKPFWR